MIVPFGEHGALLAEINGGIPREPSRPLRPVRCTAARAASIFLPFCIYPTGEIVRPGCICVIIAWPSPAPAGKRRAKRKAQLFAAAARRFHQPYDVGNRE
jgi:hypothetical protein